MLIEFSVENYLSIKERITFSMMASKDTSLQENLIKLDGYNKNITLLKTGVIYGANASGKTNVLKAMKFMIDFVNNSHQVQKGSKTGVSPFKLDNNINKPSCFDIIFIHKGVRYAYGFLIDQDKIYEEYLYSYPKGKKRIVFERTNINEYAFKNDIEEQKGISARNIDNSLYLSTATKWNYAPCSEAFEWFNEQVKMFIVHNDLKWLEYTSEKINQDANFLSQAIEFIQNADPGISDINVTIKETGDDAGNNKDIYEIKTFHVGKNDDGKNQHVMFDIKEESNGTQKFFALMGPWMNVLQKGQIIIIDELDSRLHPVLTKALVKMFNNTDINTKNAQLIFTTHDTHILNRYIFRRDQVWFAEKNPNIGATDLYSLLVFSPRKDEVFEKGYLAGRYGAVPFLKEEFI